MEIILTHNIMCDKLSRTLPMPRSNLSACNIVVESQRLSVFRIFCRLSIQSSVKANGSGASPSVLSSRTPRAAYTSPQVSSSLIMPGYKGKFTSVETHVSGPSGASLGEVSV